MVLDIFASITFCKQVSGLRKQKLKKSIILINVWFLYVTHEQGNSQCILMTKIRQISMKIKAKANSLDKNSYSFVLLLVFWKFVKIKTKANSLDKNSYFFELLFVFFLLKIWKNSRTLIFASWLFSQVLEVQKFANLSKICKIYCPQKLTPLRHVIILFL